MAMAIVANALTFQTMLAGVHDMRMLDDDLMIALKARAHAESVSLTRVINRTLRAGLGRRWLRAWMTRKWRTGRSSADDESVDVLHRRCFPLDSRRLFRASYGSMKYSHRPARLGGIAIRNGGDSYDVGACQCQEAFSPARWRQSG